MPQPAERKHFAIGNLHHTLRHIEAAGELKSADVHLAAIRRRIAAAERKLWR